MNIIIEDYISLCKAIQTKRKEMSTMLKPYNITPDQLVVLYQFRDGGGGLQKSLVSQSNKDKGNISRIVQRMLKSGLLNRKQDSKFLVLTPKAEEIINKIDKGEV